jgi:hypothetical protein
VVVKDLLAGTHVTLVGDGSSPRPPTGVSIDVWSGHRPVEVIGHDRIESLVTEAAGQRATLPCDAVVLAGDLRPLRNVDGAIVQAPDVTYIQPTAATLTAQNVVDHAREAVSALMAKEA